MNKYAIDINVFSKMTEFADVYNKYGYKTLQQYIQVKKDLYNETKKAVLFCLDDDFINENAIELELTKQGVENLNDYKLVEFTNKYLDYVANLKNYIKELVDTNVKLTKKLKDDTLSPLYKNQLLNKLNKNNQTIKVANKKYNILLIKSKNLKSFNAALKSQKQTIDAAELFSKAVTNNVELCVLPTTIKEIKNNIYAKSQLTNPKVKKRELKFTLEDVLNLSQHLTLYTISSSNVAKKVSELSEDFRTKNKAFKNCEPMQNHINTVYEFGDANLIAEGVVCGLNVLTFKKSDFINYEGLIIENEFIRNQIRQVCNVHFKNQKCAVPVTFEDINAIQPVQKPPVEFKVVSSQKAKQYFNKVKAVNLSSQSKA